MAAPLPVVKGTLDLLVLKALAWGPMHGYEVGTWLEGHSNGTLALDDSGLYQSLYRLEGRGLIAADWGVTANNRRARYYTLSRSGRSHLTHEADVWARYAAAVSAILAVPQPAR